VSSREQQDDVQRSRNESPEDGPRQRSRDKRHQPTTQSDKARSSRSESPSDGRRNVPREKRHGSTKQQSPFKVPIIGVFVLALGGVAVYFWYNTVIRDIVRTPLQATKITEMPLNLHDAARYWGTYRSGLYFGMKTRSPRSPVVG
jgi:hypothetical protein